MNQVNFCSQRTDVWFLSTANSAVLSQIRGRESAAANATFKHSHPASVHQLRCCACNACVAASCWTGRNFWHTANTCTVSLPCGPLCDSSDIPTDQTPCRTRSTCIVCLPCGCSCGSLDSLPGRTPCRTRDICTAFLRCEFCRA